MTGVTLHNFTKSLVYKQLVVFQSKIRCAKKTVKAARDVTVSVYPHLTKSIRNMMRIQQHRSEQLIHLILYDAKQKKNMKTQRKELKIESSISLKNNKSIKEKS